MVRVLSDRWCCDVVNTHESKSLRGQAPIVRRRFKSPRLSLFIRRRRTLLAGDALSVDWLYSHRLMRCADAARLRPQALAVSLRIRRCRRYALYSLHTTPRVLIAFRRLDSRLRQSPQRIKTYGEIGSDKNSRARTVFHFESRKPGAWLQENLTIILRCDNNLR